MTEMIKVELKGGQLDGQTYEVPGDTESILLAKDFENLAAGAYIYGDKKVLSDGAAIYMRYLGINYGATLKTPFESSSKVWA